MCQIAVSGVCLTAPSARLCPRRGLSRRYCAAGQFALARMAAMAASSSAKSSHLEPSRVLPERRLPADWSLPGHCPAHEARCRGDANRVMSAPISARMHWAPRRWMPTVVQSSSTAAAKGADLFLDGVREPVDLFVQEVDVGEDRPDPERVMSVEVAGERF